MANIKVKDADATVKYRKATGAGSDVDPYITEHKETNSASSLASLQAIEADTGSLSNAISGNEMQVDVVTSTLPAGSATETTLSAVKTAVESLATTVSATELQVDVLTSALPSGAATSAKQDTIISHVDGIEGLLTTIETNTDSLVVVGGGAEATALRVTIANDSTGVLSIDDGGGSITVDGSLEIDTALPAGDNNIGNVDIVSSVLPTGASTSANQTTIIGHIDGIEGLLTSIDTDTSSMNTDLGTLAGAVAGTEVQVDIVSGDVTNTGTFVVQIDGDALTSLQLIDNIVQVEDSPHSSTDSGVMALAVRQDSQVDFGADGDYVPLSIDGNGALRVTGGGGGTQYNIDDVLGATDTVTLAGVVRDDSLTTLTEADGDVSVLRVSSTGALHVTGGGGGTEYTEDIATADPIVGTATLMERDDALTTVTPIEGDWIGLRGSAEGALWVQDYNSDAILADTANMDTNLGTLAGAVTGSEIQVDIVSDGAGLATAANQLADGHNVTIDNAAGASAVNIQDGGNTITVDGTVDLGTTDNAVLDAIQTATETTAGAVTGSEMQVDIVTAPTLTVNSHDVTNAGTFVVQEDGDALTALQLIDDIVLAEDVLHVSGDEGVMSLAVRQDSDSAFSGDGDYTPLQVDSSGFLKVNIKAGAGSGGTASTDDSAFTAGTGSGTPMMGFATSDTVDAGDVGVVAMDTDRNLKISIEADNAGIGGGVQYDISDVLGATDTVTLAGVVRDDALTTLTEVDGDVSVLRVNSTGALHVTGGGGGTEYTEHDAVPGNPTGGTLLVARDDIIQTVTEPEGDWIRLRGTAEGALWIQDYNSDDIKTAVEAIQAGQLADSHNVTIDNPSGAGAVYIQSGSNSITVDDGGTSLTVDSADLTTIADAVVLDHMQVDIVDVTPDLMLGTDFSNVLGTASIVDGSNHLQVDIAADSIGIGGGTQYTEADTDATIVGTAMMWEDSADTLRAISATYPLPVDITDSTIAVTQSGSWDIEDISAGTQTNDVKITLDGESVAVTMSTLPDTAGGDLADIETNTDFGAVTGGGTETGALRVTLANNSTGLISVDDNDSSLTIDNADLTTLAGAVSAGQMQVDIVDALPAGDNNIGNVDIASSVSLDVSAATVTVDATNLDIRDLTNASDSILVYGSDDSGTTKRVIKTDAGGAVQVDIESVTPDLMLGTDFSTVFGTASVVDGSDHLQVDIAADSANLATSANQSTMITSLQAIDDPVATISATDLFRVAIFDDSDSQITSFGGGTQYDEDDSVPANPTGTAMMMERDDALGGLTPIEGDWTHPFASAEGALWVQDFNSDAILADTANMDTNLGTLAGAVTGSEMQVDIVSDGAGLATSANQSTIIGHLDGVEGSLVDIETNTDYGAVVGGGAEATALRVTIANDSTGLISVDDNGNSLTIDNADITTIAGAVTGSEMQVDVVAALPAGTNTIGSVNVEPQTSGGCTPFRSIDVDESEEEIKATAGQIYSMYLYNSATAARFIKFYDATAATVVVGTTTPELTFELAAGQGLTINEPNGIAFDTAICIAATTAVGDSDTGAPGANEVLANVFYK